MENNVAQTAIQTTAAKPEEYVGYVRLEYFHDKRLFSFDYDTRSRDHKQRIIDTITWAAKQNICLTLVPILFRTRKS